MKVKYFARVCVILLLTVSFNCMAAQPLQYQDQSHNRYINKSYYLSSKYLSGGHLKVTPIVSKQLSKYEKGMRGGNTETNQKHKTVTDGYIDGSVQDPRLRSIKSALPSHKYIDDVFEISHEYNIDPLLLHAIAEVESHFDPLAISPAGAKGLMQIMPATARRFGMNNPETGLFNPRDNLRICSNYLRSLHSLFGNNIPLILAAYNAGEHAVIKYGNTIPPYLETQRYVTKVMRRYLELKDLTYKL